MFGIVEMAVELLHQAGGAAPAVGGHRAVPDLATVVLTVQRDLSGSTFYQDWVNTRLRGALCTAVAPMPLRFGRHAQA